MHQLRMDFTCCSLCRACGYRRPLGTGGLTIKDANLVDYISVGALNIFGYHATLDYGSSLRIIFYPLWRTPSRLFTSKDVRAKGIILFFNFILHYLGYCG